MTAAKNDGGPPAGAGRSSNNLLAGGAASESNRQARQDRAAAQVRGCFVTAVSTSDGHYRRRCFLSLKAAERAVERAEAAGHEATGVLCRLVPVEGWTPRPPSPKQP
jgi:hypothetical protein